MEEKELIESAKRGNDHSFAKLFQANYPFLLKYLLKVTMNPDTAEELAQETMVKCIEKLSYFKGDAKFSTWLIAIASNLYMDKKRKWNRERIWKKNEAYTRKLKWQLESRCEDWSDVMEALGKLPDDVRLPIILKHYYGYSYEEIGSMLNKSPGTMKSRVHNGMQQMRKELRLE